MNRQRRAIPHGAVRAFEENGEHFVNLLVTKYNVVDEYKTVWLPGVFSRSLDERPPTLAWGHNWQDPIGRAVSWTDSADGPIVQFRLDDFEDVPQARRAFSQVNSGTIDDCSVGFSNLTSRAPTPSELEQFPGAVEMMVDADLDETSLVLRGAVPGAKVLALRSPQVIDAEIAGQIMARFGAGEIDLLEALQSVKDSSIVGVPDETADPNEPDKTDAPTTPDQTTAPTEPDQTAQDDDAGEAAEPEIDEALEAELTEALAKVSGL